MVRATCKYIRRRVAVVENLACTNSNIRKLNLHKTNEKKEQNKKKTGANFSFLRFFNVQKIVIRRRREFITCMASFSAHSPLLSPRPTLYIIRTECKHIRAIPTM